MFNSFDFTSDFLYEGQGVKKFRRNENFYKVYPFRVFKTDTIEIKIRLQKIKENVPYCFNYRIIQKLELIVIEQEFINPIRKSSLSLDDLQSIAFFLDRIHNNNLIHGDLHLRNIILSNKGPVIIDWEPCFYQLLKGKRIIKSSKNILHPNDKISKTVSVLSDLNGYQKLFQDKMFSESFWDDENDSTSCIKIYNNYVKYNDSKKL